MVIWLIVGLSIVCVWIWCLLFILEYRISRREQKLSSRYMVNTQNVNDSIKRVKKRASLKGVKKRTSLNGAKKRTSLKGVKKRASSVPHY